MRSNAAVSRGGSGVSVSAAKHLRSNPLRPSTLSRLTVSTLSFSPPSFLSSAEGLHPVQWRGGGACLAAGAGDRRGQRTLAPPPPAAILPVAAQASEPVKGLLS